MINIKTLENEVKSLIYTIYEAKKNKDIQFLNRIYRNKEKFSKYSWVSQQIEHMPGNYYLFGKLD